MLKKYDQIILNINPSINPNKIRKVPILQLLIKVLKANLNHSLIKDLVVY